MQRRVPRSRAIQCAQCSSILEERGLSDLTPYYAETNTPELHCAVTPDMVNAHVGTDDEEDPLCAPGFVTAFQTLSLMREPVYAASARTISGALCEMERHVGDAIYGGYVGYNGRTPGAATAAAQATAQEASPPDTRPPTRDGASGEGEGAGATTSGCDARHTIVAYFEILDLCNILEVDKETCDMAIAIFRYTASSVSLRNRNVEALAAASLCAAVQRRLEEHVAWQEGGGKSPCSEPGRSRTDSTAYEPASSYPRPSTLSSADAAGAAGLNSDDVFRCLKMVNMAIGNRLSDSSACLAAKVPAYCTALGLSDAVQSAARKIAERAFATGVCPRRNPATVCAGAIYMACQAMGLRRTQSEICSKMEITEVTLRKVYKELLGALDRPPAELEGHDDTKPTHSEGRRKQLANADANSMSFLPHRTDRAKTETVDTDTAEPEARAARASPPKHAVKGPVGGSMPVGVAPPPMPPPLPPPMPPPLPSASMRGSLRLGEVELCAADSLSALASKNAESKAATGSASEKEKT